MESSARVPLVLPQVSLPSESTPLQKTPTPDIVFITVTDNTMCVQLIKETAQDGSDRLRDVTAALMIWISVNEEGSRDAIPGQVAFWSVAITAGWLQMLLISRGVRATFDKDRWPARRLATSWSRSPVTVTPDRI